MGDISSLPPPRVQDGCFLSASLPIPIWISHPMTDTGSLTIASIPDPHSWLPAQTICSVKSCLDEGMSHQALSPNNKGPSAMTDGPPDRFEAA